VTAFFFTKYLSLNFGGFTMRKMFIALLVFSLFVGLSIQPASAAEERSYLLIFSTENLPADLETRVQRAGGTVSNAYEAIGVASATSDRANFRSLAARIPGVIAAVPNTLIQWIDPPQVVPLEIGYPPESGAGDVFFDLQWGHTAIDAPGAWNAGYRGAGARVAVLDTGFDLTHPDLAPNINLELSANFVPGETLQYGLPGPFSHGSHVAGTIAAAQNDFGVIGVAPEAELVLVKVLGDAGSGTFEWVMAGIIHAADVDADVINMSLGAAIPRRGYEASTGEWVGANDVAALLTAIGRTTNYAYQNGTTIITSAGNSALNLNHTADLVVVPAMSPHVIAISATAPIGWAVDPFETFLDNLASYSNHGTSVIDFAAPGGDFIYPGDESCTIAGLLRPCWVFDLVFSTGNGGWYWSAGTSMAAPHAAGVAALIVSANGGSMHPAQVEAALRHSADDLGKPGKDDAYGHGRVNAANAVD
jgi:lantibiotic leader peptide-processing serine protease